MTATRDQIVRRETLVSVIINAVISALMFAVVFGFEVPVPVRAPMGFATDFLPQVFMVSLMGSLVPALLTMHRSKTRDSVRLIGLAGNRAIVLRSLLVAVSAGFLLGGGLAAAFWLLSPASLSTLPALAIKILVGSAVAAVITPSAVRHALPETQGGATPWQA